MTSETYACAPHDELRFELWPLVEGRCERSAVVSVIDPTGATSWGCGGHAAATLAYVEGSKLSKIADWDAARLLLALPWNR